MQNMETGEIRKRNIAYKIRIGDVLKGKPFMEEGKFLFLELGNMKIVRVNMIANCVDKYVQDSEKKFASLTVDDASGQIKLKAFGDDIGALKEIMQGDTLQIIGNVREWNGELYIIPEIAKKVDPRWLLVRKLEIQNLKKDLPSDSNSPIREVVMKKIKESEGDGGIDVDTIIMDVESRPELINGEIKKLLEEGLIYEPRPGRLRYLG
jgi:RPA family protein